MKTRNKISIITDNLNYEVELVEEIYGEIPGEYHVEYIYKNDRTQTYLVQKLLIGMKLSMNEKDWQLIPYGLVKRLSKNLNKVNMKTYTEEEVIELLRVQRGNCYVAVLSRSGDVELSSAANSAPEPGSFKRSKNDIRD